ncbi:FHA domain protein [Bacteriovorax sp. BAL6_X]|uniref:FHA domain-containing protein n=1 Tax=Bacteriovorax sp. BAL6_X TaxID=1201290 RepID=UPI00038645B6|nr:FHA domain-containing protein [Bacteriovorax sp. BAL6_X]EPZ52042.1 FHA domain protein [Bacteriovorax sp. BAL6_X]
MIITVSKHGTILNRIEINDQVIMGQSSSFLIGRSDEAHVHLDDPQISRRLASLNFNGVSWTLNKLSTYDTVLVNNAPMFLEEISVSSGHYLVCNDYKVLFESLEVEEQDAQESIEPELPEDVFEDVEPEDSLEEEETAIIDGPVENSSDFEEETQAFDDPTQDSTHEEEGEFGASENIEAQEGDFDEFGQQEDGFSDGFDENYDENYDGDYDDNYGDESYDIDTLDDDVGDKTQVFSGFANFVLELFGEDVPYDHFNLDLPETYIGRDPSKCQIVLTDPEVSSVHAVIRKNKITCILEDLQSANGTILNGKRINQKEITNGDEFIIGSTTFTVKIASDFIKSQQDMLMPVEDNQVIEVEEVVEVSDDDEDFDDLELSGIPTASEEKSIIKRILNDPEKRKKVLIYTVVLLGVYMFLFPDSGEKPKATAKDKQAKEQKKKQVVTSVDKKLTKEQQEKAEALYQLATRYANEGNVAEAITEFERLFLITKDYKQAQTFYQLAKDKYAELEKAELERRAEEKRKLIQAKVKDLLDKATEAVKERNVTLSRGLFQQIKELDPNNYDVANLELELDSYIKEKNRKELEEAQKKAERQRMVDALKPGETLFLQEEWFKAIGALELFISEKSMDEDLMKKAIDMLKKSRQNLKNITGPLLGKARSLKEAEDLKASYEVFKEVLRYNPNELDAQSELDDINDILTRRARKVYRQGLISESLGSFEDAREKFQEVQQISPIDNEYYLKASERLKNL